MDSLKWWQTAVFYQIYPRSFADGNGDGIGDFCGMIQKLGYLQDLGVDAVWLSPHFPSPQFDCGYDVSDYEGIALEYGTMEDFKEFLDGLHQRGMRLILDLVLNHTSHLHHWFQESRQSRVNPKSDWYVWRDPVNGGPPNNWYSTFGGPAWEFDGKRGQYYYHFFYKEQPDLNWKHPGVKQAIFDSVRFWLKLGVDGFRLDAIDTIFELESMPNHLSGYTDAQLNLLGKNLSTEKERAEWHKEFMKMFGMQFNQPGVHELMQELRQVVDEFEDKVLVGESDSLTYHGTGDDELHLIFNFPLMRTRKLTPAWIQENQETRLAALPDCSWPCNTLGNHDVSRVISQFGDGEHDQEIARLALALMLTLWGTPFLYNGEEIGMTDFMLQDIRQFRDLRGVWLYELELSQGASAEDALHRAAKFTRDKCRTPMQWSNAPNAGFSPQGVIPWLPVNPNFAGGVNVEDQQANPQSLLHFYRQMLRLRKETPELIDGAYHFVSPQDDHVFAFERRSPTSGQSCLVLLNFSAQARTYSPGLPYKTGKILFGTHQPAGTNISLNKLELSPFEILIARLN